MFLNVFMCPFQVASFIKNVDVHSQKGYCNCVCATLKRIAPRNHLEAVEYHRCNEKLVQLVNMCIINNMIYKYVQQYIL